MLFFNLLLVFLSLNNTSDHFIRKADIAETVVFDKGEGDYQCFRIPAIVKAPNGDLLAFAEARRNNCGDFGDIDIVLKRSTDQGKNWGEMAVAADFGINQAGNPAPVFDLTDPRYPKGRLFLFYNTGTVSEAELRTGKAVREVWYKTSTDRGRTWSEAVNITTQVSRPLAPEINPAYDFGEDWRWYANTPGHGLQISQGKYRGRILIAANHSAGPEQANYRDCAAHAFYTDDHGDTFQLSPTVVFAGGNEATAAETADGSLLINFRNQSGEPKYRVQAFSDNAGQSWADVKVMQDLPDPVCQGSMIAFRPKTGPRVLLFSNLNSQTKREKLTVRISTDDGRSWSPGKEICGGSSAYSDLVIGQNDTIGVLYEKDNYTRISYARLDYDWLKE